MDRLALLSRLKTSAHEGWRLVVYDDGTGKPIGPGSLVVGHPTIAAGVNLDDALTEEQGESLTLQRIADSEDELDRELPWWRSLSEVRQQVVAELHFMMGWPVLSQFHNMLGQLQVGNTSGAAEELLNSEEAKKAPARLKILASALKANSF